MMFKKLIVHVLNKKQKEDSMIGLSLSLCIQDIIEGRVPVADVEKLITATCFFDQEEWEVEIYNRRKTTWSKNPDLAEKIVRQLLAAEKIEQPRLKNLEHFPVTRWGKKIRWVESEDQIEWYK
jgi:hypothetical protein